MADNFTRSDMDANDPIIRKAVFDLKIWQQGESTNFTTMLYELIAKADFHNKVLLSMGFPVHVAVYSAWQQAPTQSAFFEQFKI